MPRGKENKKKIPDPDPHTGAIQQRGGERSAAAAIERDLPYLEIPRDDEDWRFVKAHRVGDEDAQAFFDRYGFVVFGALDAHETELSRREIVEYIAASREGFEAGDESTWGLWRSQQFGMPPNGDESAYWQPQLARNRRHPRVATAFAQLLRCPPSSLRCAHDRWALYPNGIRTRRNVHLDINPWLYAYGQAAIAARRAEYAYASAGELFGGSDNLVSSAEGPHLQGTLALRDNEEHDAGFICVPGSHAIFDRWAAALPELRAGGPRYDFPDHSVYHKQAQRVPVREGSLIVWDVRLVHGSTPDQSPHGVPTRSRFVQFVTLRTCRLLGDEQAARRQALVRRLFAAHRLEEPRDPLERAVAGLEAVKVERPVDPVAMLVAGLEAVDGTGHGLPAAPAPPGLAATPARE